MYKYFPRLEIKRIALNIKKILHAFYNNHAYTTNSKWAVKKSSTQKKSKCSHDQQIEKPQKYVYIAAIRREHETGGLKWEK